ncbi:CDP-glycerol glycerophosphotransferase family protein [Chromatiaceae bacterium AAb-1]|nr:CDP-glycerol glycerophosphotransferase family protein [Chromatiaceae bacterium AAb-1]
MKIFFDVPHLYYLPQYLPVYQELLQHGITAEFLFYRAGNPVDVMQQVITQEQLTAHWVTDEAESIRFYAARQPDWLIIGNRKKQLDTLPATVKTALMQHGIGPKSCYYDVSEHPTTVRFVEGQHRLQRLHQRFPQAQFVDTGYAKLDPLLKGQPLGVTLSALKLDPARPTLLYAPTFYPSSLECFSEHFPRHFSGYNLIIKPHYFSLTKADYKKQRDLLQYWAAQPNVYLAPVTDYNLLPFMQLADIMLSDASSAIFEFAALGKPVIWCNFYKLRWSYRGILGFRLKKRLDPDILYFRQLSTEITAYRQLEDAVEQAIQLPAGAIATRNNALIRELAGETDGKCSERIAATLLTM